MEKAEIQGTESKKVKSWGRQSIGEKYPMYRNEGKREDSRLGSSSGIGRW